MKEVKEMKLGPVKNWQDFVMMIMPFMARSLAGVHRFGTDYPPYLFRGQEKTEYKLVSSIFRDINDPIKVKVTRSFFKKERAIIGVVRNRIADYLNCSEWDLMAVAQHHGVHTRYLDWTSDPFVALAFAFNKTKDKKCKGQVGKAKRTPVIWVLKTNVDDFCIPESAVSPIPDGIGAKTKIYVPNKVVGQVFAQDSYLMRQVVEKNRDGKNNVSYTVIPLEENPTFKGRLWKIEFSEKSIKEIEDRLNALRIDVGDLKHPDDWKKLKAECEDILKKSSES